MTGWPAPTRRLSSWELKSKRSSSMAKAKATSPFAGLWHIVSMSGWDEDYFNEEVQAFIELEASGTGHFQFGYVQGYMDWRPGTRDGQPGVEWTWEGADGAERTGRGWAKVEDDGRVEGWRAHGRVRWQFHGFRRGPQSGSPGHVSSPRHVERSGRISRTPLSCPLRAEDYATGRSGSAFGGGHRLLHLSRPTQPSPRRISPASGLADRWVLFSGHPCLPCCRRKYEQQGPFAPRALPRFAATAGPSATLSSSADFPGLPVIRPTQLPRISPRDEEGFSSCSLCPCRRAVANHPAGVTRRVNRLATCHAAFALQLQARPPGLLPFGATSRSLALRPGDSHPSRGGGCQWASGHSVSLLPAIQLRGFRLLPRRD